MKQWTSSPVTKEDDNKTVQSFPWYYDLVNAELVRKFRGERKSISSYIPCISLLLLLFSLSCISPLSGMLHGCIAQLMLYGKRREKKHLSCQKLSYLLSKSDRIALQGLHLFLFRMSLLCNAEGLLHALKAYSCNL